MYRSQIQLDVDETPKNWYNIQVDMPELPGWKAENPEQWDTFRRIFAKECARHEFSKDRWIRIPEDVRELLIHTGRPLPLVRARRLEQLLKTPARIYYKREDLGPTGSFKTTMTIPGCYFGWKEGYQRVVTSTGAGQTGTANAYAARLLGMDCTIYWYRSAYNLKPDRRALMRLYGANVYASPSDQTKVGREYLKKDPNHPGTGGIIGAEAIEDVLSHEDSFHVKGSVYNHTLVYTSIIGLEVKKQLQQVEEQPSIIVSCVGAGSNFGGIIAPFLRDVIDKKIDCRLVAVETESSPRFTRGQYRYDYYDSLRATPSVKMYTMGVDYPCLPTVYAEGLRYHGQNQMTSYLKNKGIIEAKSYPADEKLIFEGLRMFIQTEGFLPAPESGYGIRACIDEALKAKEEKQQKVIVVNITGNGFLDMEGYKKKLDLA